MSNPFGPGLGYDPAKPAGQQERMHGRVKFELPAAAYKEVGVNYAFPSDLPLRPPTLNTSGKAIQVRVNQFKVLKWPQQSVYQYDVIIGDGAQKRGLCMAVWESKTLREKLQSLDKFWLFDGNRIAWCKTPMPRGELRIIIDLDAERGIAPKVRRDGTVRENKHRVQIKQTKEINMAVIKAYLERAIQFDNSVLEAVTFLDHVMREFPQRTYTMVKRSFFAKGTDGRYPLDDTVEAMKGVYTSMRLTSLTPSNGPGTGLAVNVDVANGTFWTSQVLHQCARNLCKMYNRQNKWDTFADLLKPTEFQNGNGALTKSDCFKQLRKLEKIRFNIKHRGKQEEKKDYILAKFVWTAQFGKEGAHAKNVKFPVKIDPNNTDKNAPTKMMSVYDYFVERYNIYLEYWFLPLVETPGGAMYPMEVCTVKANQRYPYKIGPDQTARMIKFAVTRPKERIGAIQHGLSMLKLDHDPWLNHYGIKVDPNMTLANARLLPNPEIQFNGAKLNPGVSGRWDLRGKKFFKANPQPLKSWGFCIIDNCVEKAVLDNFIKVFINAYVGHGGNVVNKTPFQHRHARGSDLAVAVAAVRQGTGQQSQADPQIIFYVLPDKNSIVYERLKKNMDCRFGIVSQMMQKIHVEKAQPQYCSNVCMKVNAKLGGCTSRIAGKDMKTAKPFFQVPTMVIGADVSHAAPGSPQASMAAITMSMDQDACRYAAAVQTNGRRVEMISSENWKSMFMPLFEIWKTNIGRGQGPQHIYYFRDGVSEGQFFQVLNSEVADMKKAIYGAYPKASIKFTVIVCTKRHHIRFLPKEGDSIGGDRNGNPNPGTLVERDVTHPHEYDFYLNSHSAIQGTARPVHYQVILDEAAILPSKLHAMIYEHCYQYMRSTTPVSLYPAVYYAHLASNRARAHENAPPKTGPRGGQKFTEAQNANAGKNVPAPTVSSLDDSAEAPPLLQLGDQASQAVRAAIIPSMWYI